ncbi:MAG TPA: hypothetical protein VIP11_23755 [Gemmatimonadaceae bacterium]
MLVAMQRRIIALAILALPAAAQAQDKAPNGYVQVTARDSSGGPVPQAELIVTRGLKEVVARGTTNDAGVGTLAVPVKDSSELQITMRKIGYLRGDYFLAVKPYDTTRVTITVAPPRPSTLAPVTVTAEADLRRKSYHLEADDIERATMPLDNGWEVVKRLRPDMLTSRGGCESGAREVWVNGKRIRLPLMPTGMAAARARVGVPARAKFSYVPVSVLSEIAPEHIQTLDYHDCFDTSMAAVGNNDAIFVVLKPGVAYVMNVGSFVVGDTTKQAHP